MEKQIFIFFSCFLLSLPLHSQEATTVNLESENHKPFENKGLVLDFFEISGLALVANDDSLPFWMYRNTNDRMRSQTNAMGLLRGSASYYFSETSYIEVGAGVVAADGFDDTTIHRDELYLSYQNSWLKATLGSKTPFQKYQGLSIVGDNFLLSGNARALPGLIIEANNPIQLLKGLELDWAIAHYSLNDDRYVDDAMVHYKRLGLTYGINEKNRFSAGIEHYAQWGGTSPEFGKLPNSFNDFLKVFIASNANEDAPLGDQLNGLGNHLGIYNFEYIHNSESGYLKMYHQHPFEDGSGSAFKNFPDGIWGLYIGPNTKDYDSFVTGFLIEFVQTTNQSGAANEGSSRDNYFNNSIYASGWTYHQTTIGIPLLVPYESRNSIRNNKSRGINLGIAMGHKRWSFKSKVSFVENFGSFADPIDPKERAVYSYINTKYSLDTYGSISLLLGYDYSNQNEDNFGGGLQYSYKF
ncbi:capsule assembly Wzi family protein [Ulvibacter litoralis]|uniref:Capsule assembly protein Wzi n=1 Tax=Ulvibacter litoralis TaxID=227084 RepID=A0A1G7HP16_9FLAO|nr:capsule assembly Wzi family protein [Ulvibacter litoralis]GHC58523.1 hypothetical protein GCM10008083_24150 [Ulvibacter litoralis]SDF02153.1 Capsule assembly protein Wzi [Ulvibacter litoralis]